MILAYLALLGANVVSARASDPTLSCDDRRAIAWMGILGFAAAYVFTHPEWASGSRAAWMATAVAGTRSWARRCSENP